MIEFMQVHHLIEECIIFNMSKEECMEALSKHANIKPVITSTGQSPFLHNSQKPPTHPSPCHPYRDDVAVKIRF